MAAACAAGAHRGPVEVRRRDGRRAQQQCAACLRPIGRPLALEQFADEGRSLQFWLRARSAGRGTRKRRTYQAFLRSAVWRAQRLRVLERDRYVCRGEGCGEPATTVHHRSYRPVLAEVPDSELAASCARCNLAERAARIGRDRGRGA